MLHDVLVPLDGSADSARALGPAAALARYLDSEVVAVAYHDDENRIELTSTIDEQLRGLGETKCRLVLEPLGSSIGEQIGEMINLAPGRLVCMSSRGRGRSAAIMGSVASDVLRVATGPIVLIGPSYEASSFRCHGPLVVAVTDDRQSRAILPTAEAFANGFDYDLDIVTMDAHDPASAIVDYATRTRAALIAMATHNPTGVRRLLLGSTTASVLQKARCPIVTVRPSHEFE